METTSEQGLTLDEIRERLGEVRKRSVKTWLAILAKEDRDVWMDAVKGRVYRPLVLEVIAAFARNEISLPQGQEVLAGRRTLKGGPLEVVVLPVTREWREEELAVVSWPKLQADGSLRHFPNPYVIQARRDNGELVYVRVTSSRNFCPHARDGTAMRLRAKWDGTPASWELVGPPPRSPGRW